MKSNQLGPAQPEEEIRGHVWRFDVAKSYSGENAGDEVVLDFEGLASIPDEAIVCLVDRHLEKSIDIREESTYSFYLGKRGLVSTEDDARFALLVGSKAFIDEQEEEMPNPPAQTILHQNYPNPFNPSTIIRYEIAQTDEVSISIYDVNGALVKTLDQGSHNPGRYEIGWNGDNEKGARVASGVYFYRLVAGDFAQTRKMVLLR